MEILHSADWQLGCRFDQFGDKADPLRQVRLATLQRALDFARRQAVDAFVVAGDLFDDNAVADSVVTRAVEIFGAYPDVPIFLLPGNHDPFTGPGSVWERPCFRQPPANVRVLRQAEVVELDRGFLLASPLHQKQSTLDPSLKLKELAANSSGSKPLAGFTHGSLAIPGLHQPNDFPIHVEAATRAQLDYLGVGHWHNWQIHDGGRLVMPGTPEPDSFDQSAPASVAHVTLGARGELPRVERVALGQMQWRTIDFDLLDMAAARLALESALRTDFVALDKAVVRVRLRGTAGRAALEELRGWLTRALEGLFVRQVQDESRLALTASELAHLQGTHPILAQVLADLDSVGAYKLNLPATHVTADPITPAQVDALLAGARIETVQLAPAHLERARQVLLQTLQEVA